MELVVDTSVLIAVVAREPARDVLIRQTMGVELVAPASVHWEIGNAFAAMLKRRRVSLDLVYEALASYERIPLRYVEVPLENALRLADELGIYAYDAYVIACAQRQQCSLISLDRGLTRAAARAGITVLEV
ncbi:MAG: type II toxin-antitoxin system VapC family toxin [Gemmatimonadaceae bacterium]|nr:type II toxin-antitoxin system VapC family toxin [Gemmatimonadaceae bacterium]